MGSHPPFPPFVEPEVLSEKEFDERQEKLKELSEKRVQDYESVIDKKVNS